MPVAASEVRKSNRKRKFSALTNEQTALLHLTSSQTRLSFEEYRTIDKLAFEKTVYKARDSCEHSSDVRELKSVQGR